MKKLISWAKKHKDVIEYACIDFCFAFIAVMGAIFGGFYGAVCCLQEFNVI